MGIGFLYTAVAMVLFHSRATKVFKLSTTPLSFGYFMVNCLLGFESGKAD